MKKIPLTRGKFALVDDEDFEWLSEFKWYCSSCTQSGVTRFYAARNMKIYGKPRTRSMHRIMIGVPNLQVDHKDGNGLNNQRENLRLCTQSQNLANQVNHKHGGFKGVHFMKSFNKWHAYINKERRRFNLGYFDYAVDAAISYNEKAKELFGEFANLNIIPE